MTFTPLLGVTKVVRRFLIDKVPGTRVTTMTIDDAEHFTPEERAAIVVSSPEFEREARTKGIPLRGSGAVFPISIDRVLCQSFPIPDHCAQICGIDFGWSHPSAGVRLAFDRDSDVLYVIAAHRAKEQTPLIFTGAVKPWGDRLPWAWPHDGHQSGGKFDAKRCVAACATLMVLVAGCGHDPVPAFSIGGTVADCLRLLVEER